MSAHNDQDVLAHVHIHDGGIRAKLRVILCSTRHLISALFKMCMLWYATPRLTYFDFWRVHRVRTNFGLCYHQNIEVISIFTKICCRCCGQSCSGVLDAKTPTLMEI